MKSKKFNQINSNELGKSLDTDETQEFLPKISSDPAADAGLTKVDFYKTDKWVVGWTKPSTSTTYIAQKNTIPPPLDAIFAPALVIRPVADGLKFDKKKFGLLDMPDFENKPDGIPLIIIESYETGNQVAAIQFRTDSFVVNLANLPKKGTFPFDKYEFLNAVHAAKYMLEVFLLPDNDKDLDR